MTDEQDVLMKKLDDLRKQGYTVTIVMPTPFGVQNRNTEDDN